MKKALTMMFLVAAIAACTSSSGSTGSGGSGGGTDGSTGSDGAAATDAATGGGDGAAAGTDTAAGGGDTATAGETAAAGDTANGGGDAAVVADATVADTGAAAGGTWKEAEPAMKAKCATCHSPVAKNVFQAGDCASSASKASSIKTQIETGKMPQKPLPALEASEKKAILDWVAAGAKCP